MPGLLDLLGGNFGTDDPRQAAYLALASGLLSGKGSFNSVAGNAMMDAQRSFLGNRAAGQEAKLRQAEIDAIARKAEEDKRQRELDAKFRELIPDPQQEAIQTALSNGLGPTIGNAANIQPVDPTKQLLYQAMKLQQGKPLDYIKAIQKDTSPQIVKNDSRVYSHDFNKLLVDAIPDSTKQSSLAQMISEMNALPAGSPMRAIYLEAIKKATTHAPAATAISYGSPVPITLPDGSTGYAQPGNREGAKPQVMTGTDNKPFTKPTDQKDKDPTEFQAKAALYFDSMSKASETLNKIEQTNGWRVGLAERTVPGQDVKNAVRPVVRQSYVAAQRRWIDSINRVRSGANLPEIEYDRAERTFFPSYGEGDAIKTQKAQARAQEEAAMKIAAGRAIKQTPKLYKSVLEAADDIVSR